MPVFELLDGKLAVASPTQFVSEGLKERQDIQRMLRDQIDVLGEDLFVLAEEYGGWLDSNRRIDLLCIDSDANLVVVELKRDEAAHMELQALRYAAMVARMTFAEAVEAHADFLRRRGADGQGAESAVLSFLQWGEPQEEDFGRQVRIVLACANFGKELTTAVLWLRDQGIDISCVRLSPYRLSDGRVLLDIQQIIPLPEATEFQTQIGLKRQAEQKYQAERHEIRYEFWQQLLTLAATRTKLHAGRSPSKDNWISASAGRPGLQFVYTIRQNDSQVHLWIEDNESLYQALLADRDVIEDAFGSPLVWKQTDQQKGTYIAARVEGGYRSPREEWSTVQHALVEAMVRLEATLRPRIAAR
ncbi:DUF4268 domain-containing protein [Novosphingobium aerophilum]|uniref:DUF4268 domain-containing protein n=1 Tax=Novosphingobium aerophilum TaxID=2839843 RepID=A0A7X1FAU9_9SPHN|nr:DUF4268 domain-containing protein [Novosphingobium aerophilum]MBC2653605.1 DUF4268 domain-containing protein [Novosphingobium aerophilum]